MNTETVEPLLAVLDANVFLGVLTPHLMKMGEANVRGAERVLRAIDDADVRGATSAVALAEIRWIFARHGVPGFEIARERLLTGLGTRLQVVPVDTALAIHGAELRAKYYSRQNDISYNDALYLATALAFGAALLISSDPHLLGMTEIKVIEPQAFPEPGEDFSSALYALAGLEPPR